MALPEKSGSPETRKDRLQQVQDLKTPFKEFLMPNGTIARAYGRSQERRLAAQGGQALEE